MSTARTVTAPKPPAPKRTCPACANPARVNPDTGRLRPHRHQGKRCPGTGKHAASRIKPPGED